MKMKAVHFGALTLATPLPGWIFAILWTWIFCFGICLGALGYERIPMWGLYVGLLPLLVSLLLSLAGMVYGIVRRKEKRAWLGVLCSALCLVENVLLLAGMIYLGSRY